MARRPPLPTPRHAPGGADAARHWPRPGLNHAATCLVISCPVAYLQQSIIEQGGFSEANLRQGYGHRSNEPTRLLVGPCGPSIIGPHTTPTGRNDMTEA